MSYSSSELARLVSALKDEPGDAATLIILGGASKAQTTTVAEAIAKPLQLSLSRIDLNRVVSKFIGETEKNIDRVFADASRSGAILLLDEADALFGKRTDVKPSDDPDASVGTDYLLQRIDGHDGIVLMVVNDAAQARERARGLHRTTVLVLDR